MVKKIIKVKDYNKEYFNKLKNKYSNEVSFFISQRKKLFELKKNNVIPKELNMTIDNSKNLAVILDKIIKEEPEKLLLYTDYDNDGFCGGLIFLDFVKQKYNKNIDFHINDRLSEGYGINSNRIRKISEQGYKYILTVDLGISNSEQIDLANELGLKVFLTDHHLAKLDSNSNEIIPKAEIVVNSNLNSSEYERYVCGAYTIWEVLKHIDKNIAYNYIDLVALALISDNMPLTSPIVNYTVKCGLEKIQKKLYSSSFLETLIENHLLEKNKDIITETDLGFYIIPLINAVGRLSNVKKLLELALKWNELDKEIEYQKIVDINNKRKLMTEEFQEKAFKIAEELVSNNKKILLIELENCHEGIIGLIASRINEKYLYPTLVCTKDEKGEFFKASGRSKENYDFSLFFQDPKVKWIVEQVNEFDDEDEKEREILLLAKKNGIEVSEANKLVEGGGHKHACGMRFKSENIDILRERLEIIEQPTEFIKEVDAEISLKNELKKIKSKDVEIAKKNLKKKISTEVIRDIKENLFPFGQGNPELRFLLTDKPENIRIIEKEIEKEREGKIFKEKVKHISFNILHIKGIAFNVSEEDINSFSNSSFIGTLNINKWKEYENVQLLVENIVNNDKLEII